MRVVIALDIGGTKIAGSVVRSDGTTLSRVTRPTLATHGPGAVLDVAAAVAKDAVAAASSPGAGRFRVVAVGVGTAGMVDRSGRVVGSTATFSDWVGTDVKGELARRLSLPVEVCNDVDAHAVGESWLGSTAGVSTSLFVAVGTGVGAGVVMNGQLVRGVHGGAGEIGHMPSRLATGHTCPCGRQAHLEAVAAGPGIQRVYSETVGGAPVVDTRDVFRRAHEGDPAAVEAVDRSARAVGEAIAAVVTVIDPEVVAVGGGISVASEPWWQALTTAVRHEVVPPQDGVRVVKARLGDSAALVGAARLAWAEHP